MKIWFRDYSLEEVKFFCKDNMLEHLGIEIIELGDNFIKGKMPVDHRTVQTMRNLHGGASVALAESLGSIGAFLTLDPSKYFCVGMEINANHIKRVSDGYVYAVARPVHMGKKSHVWTIDITDENGAMVAISRITMAIIDT
jgi:1,4-dihydroxy-2-naphthoyl-CoA hydrolase